MPNSRDRTYSLILRVTQDFLQSIKARRRLSVILMVIGVLLIITGVVFLDGGPGEVLNVITAAAGLTVGSSSFLPVIAPAPAAAEGSACLRPGETRYAAGLPSARRARA